jgi:hypothetical protein
MAAILYRKYISISRPRYDEKLRVWLPYASISSHGDKFHYYQLKNLDKSFETEDEALAFGFFAARDWVDKHLSQTESRW